MCFVLRPRWISTASDGEILGKCIFPMALVCIIPVFYGGPMANLLVRLKRYIWRTVRRQRLVLHQGSWIAFKPLRLKSVRLVWRLAWMHLHRNICENWIVWAPVSLFRMMPGTCRGRVLPEHVNGNRRNSSIRCLARSRMITLTSLLIFARCR